MEVRSGYKATEVGLIPGDWELKPLGAMFAFQNGVNADREAYGQGTPFINVLEPITYSHIHGSEIPGRVTLPKAVAAAYAVRRGDVLFNRTSETQEEVGLAAVYLGDEQVVFGGFVIRGRPSDQSLDPIYSGYALRAPAIRSQVIPMGQGAIRANIGQGSLRRVIAPVPPVAEQQAIAEALGDVDALLAGLDRLIVKKRDPKQAAMQQLLTGQTRLPGFHGKWEVRRLDQLGDWKGGMTPSMTNEAFWLGGTVPWVSSGDVKAPRLHDTAAKVTQAAITSRATMLLPAESLLLVTRSGILRKFLPVAMNMVPMAINQDIKALLPSAGLSSAFLLHTLVAHGERILSRCMKSGTTVESIELRWLKAFELPIPPLPEQEAIAEVLSDMDAELAALEARRKKTRALKQAMMQELLTGRVRLV